jgi:predicted nucleic acid-binding protein
MIYFDSSALVKRYVEEQGSDKIDALLRDTPTPVTSRLAYPEILAALTRRHRGGHIAVSAFERVKRQFRTDWESLAVIEMRVEVLRFVDRLIDKHALKGADSIHLSTALWLKENVREEVIVVASDAELLRSARIEKLGVLDPQA